MFVDLTTDKIRSKSSLKDFIIDYNKQTINRYSNSDVEDEKHKEEENSIFANSHYCQHYFLKAIVIIVCVLGCLWQCASILNLFFAFPSIVFVYVETMEQLQLPGITLCNSNRVMMSKLKEFNKTFDKIWSSYDDTNHSEDNSTKLDKQMIIDDTIRALLNSLRVNDFMKLGHTSDDFLIPDYFKCATDPYHINDKCRKYANILQTAQDVGNCFTLFHRSNSRFLKEIAIQSGLSQSPVLRGHGEAVDLELADQPFHPNEILRMKINFSSKEYTTLNDEVFGHIIIHDDDESPPVREKNFYIYPGFYYEFFISKQSDTLLPAPYSTDCIDYSALSVNKSKLDSNEYLNHPLSKENCIIGCMAEKTMERCDCWPPELPFLRGSDPEAIENKMKWCDWNTGPQTHSINKPENVSWFKFCFTEHEQSCTQKCKSDCHIDRYVIIQQRRDWPAKERIEHSKHADSLRENHECCATVSVRYWSSEHTINKYEPKYELVEFISYLGGLLSMWLGLSLVSTYSVFEIIIIRLFKKRAQIIRQSKLIRNPQTSNQRRNFDESNVAKRLRRNYSNKNNWNKIRPRVSKILIQGMENPIYNKNLNGNVNTTHF